MRARTIRLPEDLDDQITRRALVNRRSINTEIMMLLEKSIDAGVQADLETLRTLRSDLSPA